MKKKLLLLSIITVFELFFVSFNAFGIDFSAFSRSEKSSWFALERAKVYYEDREYGVALNQVLDAIEIRKNEVLGAKAELKNALNYEALRRVGDDIVRLQEKLEERNATKALQVLDEIFVRKQPSDFENSMEKLLEWMDVLVEYPEALYLEGLIYAAEGEFVLSEQYYRRAVEYADNFDVLEEKYSLLYTVADMDYFTGNYDQRQKILLTIVDDDEVFGLPGNETQTLRAMKKNLDDKDKTTATFFKLYRHSSWFALKAYHDLAEYFSEQEDGMQERAFSCALLAASTVITKLSNGISERQVFWKYSTLDDLLKQAVKDADIVNWMNDNDVWGILYRLADILYYRGNTNSSKDLFNTIYKNSLNEIVKAKAFSRL